MDDASLVSELPRTVCFEVEPARLFAVAAIEEHQRCLDSRDASGVPSQLPNVVGLLFGRFGETKITVTEVAFIPNIRGSNARIIAEFEGTIASQFGEVFKSRERGFWLDEQQVLQAIKCHALRGLEPLGSIHSHPNWHEIGPPNERRYVLSENPTPIDVYLFQQSGWPVNVIWYVRAFEGTMTHRVAAWRPGPERCDRLEIQMSPAVCNAFQVDLQP